MAGITHAVFSHQNPNVCLAGLGEGEKCIFYVWSLAAQVYNGGIHEYICGPYADDIDQCIDYLREIPCGDVTEVLKNVKSLLPEGYFESDRYGREKALAEICREQSVKSLNDLIKVDVEQIDLEAVYRFYQGHQTEDA